MNEKQEGINLKDELSDVDLQIINKLGCTVHNEFYTMSISEKQHIRDEMIKNLEEKKLTDVQKQQLFDIVMSLKATLISKKRFIIYYGLDKNKTQIHSYGEIAKIQNCTYSNIRQSINAIKSKFVRLPNESIDKIRKIIKED